MNFFEIYDINGKKWLICLNHITRIEINDEIVNIFFPDGNISINQEEYLKIKPLLEINYMGE